MGANLDDKVRPWEENNLAIALVLLIHAVHN
jgi:hypothetical protein